MNLIDAMAAGTPLSKAPADLIDSALAQASIDTHAMSAMAKSFAPPELLGVADWMERHYRLPAETSAEPGLISLSRTPYMYGVAQAFDDPSVDEITLMLAAQTGKSSILLGILGQVSATPGMGAPVLFLMPSGSNAVMMANERFTPMIEASPILRESLLDNKFDGKRKTLTQKTFSNGTLINFVGSNSAADLASRPVKVLLADEVDRFAVSAGKEGSPLALAAKRTNSFALSGRKRIYTSTPTIADVSEIERLFKLGDQRHYHCECPHCLEKHILQFENIRWQGNDPETAEYPCPECGVPWSEADRLQAIRNGEWIATRPEVTGHASFHLNGLCSPWVGNWQNAVKEFLESRDNPVLEQTFVNTFLGLPYRSADLQVDEDTIIDRMKPFTLSMVPEDVLAITGGADVQQDRIELSTVGWAETGQMYILAHEIFYGDTSANEVWDALYEAITRRFQHTLGNLIDYDAVAVDSGYNTQKVMNFAAENKHLGVYAVKGVAGQRLIWEQSKQPQKGDQKLFLVGVDDAKSRVMDRLAIEDQDSPAYVHIADMAAYSHEYAKQLLSEFRNLEYKAGRPVFKWVRKSSGHKAEALDCCVYAIAVRERLYPNWEKRRNDLSRLYEDPDADLVSEDGWAMF